MRAASREPRGPPGQGVVDATREGRGRRGRRKRVLGGVATEGEGGSAATTGSSERRKRRRLLADAHTRTPVRPSTRPAVTTAMLSWSGGVTSLAPLLFCLLVLCAAGVDESGESISTAHASFARRMGRERERCDEARRDASPSPSRYSVYVESENARGRKLQEMFKTLAGRLLARSEKSANDAITRSS